MSVKIISNLFTLRFVDIRGWTVSTTGYLRWPAFGEYGLQFFGNAELANEVPNAPLYEFFGIIFGIVFIVHVHCRRSLIQLL